MSDEPRVSLEEVSVAVLMLQHQTWNDPLSESCPQTPHSSCSKRRGEQSLSDD